MSRRKSKLEALYFEFLKQPKISPATMEYVVALRSEIDRLTMELTIVKGAAPKADEIHG